MTTKSEVMAKLSQIEADCIDKMEYELRQEPSRKGDLARLVGMIQGIWEALRQVIEMDEGSGTCSCQEKVPGQPDYLVVVEGKNVRVWVRGKEIERLKRFVLDARYGFGPATTIEFYPPVAKKEPVPVKIAGIFREEDTIPVSGAAGSVKKKDLWICPWAGTCDNKAACLHAKPHEKREFCDQESSHVWWGKRCPKCVRYAEPACNADKR